MDYKRMSASLLVLAMSSLNAGTMGILNNTLGVYGGVGIGPDTIDFSQRAHIFIPSTPGFPPEADVINKAHLSAVGFFGSIFAGVSRLYNNQFYLALEGNGNFSTVAFNSYNYEFVNHSFSNTSIKIKNSWGLSLLPGYQWSPTTLLYTRVGISTNKIQEKTTDISLANFNTWRTGFRYGLGIKQALTDRLDLRVDYSRVTYSGIVTETEDPVSSVTKTTKLTPNQQLVEFGLIFHFA